MQDVITLYKQNQLMSLLRNGFCCFGKKLGGVVCVHALENGIFQEYCLLLCLEMECCCASWDNLGSLCCCQVSLSMRRGSELLWSQILRTAEVAGSSGDGLTQPPAGSRLCPLGV